MVTGVITSLDPNRRSGEVQIDDVGWRIPAERIPRGLVVGDKVAFLIETREFSARQRAVDLRRA